VSRTGGSLRGEWAHGLDDRERAARRLPVPELLERAVTSAATVSLLRWLRRQLRQPTPLREHLEAAVANDDPAEARRVLERFEFSAAQRHHVEQLLAAWERNVRARTP
jgi:hypothetical protein